MSSGNRRRLTGRLLRHASGSAHIRPDVAGEEEVFLPVARASGFMHRDRVEVRVLGRDTRGRWHGRIMQVIEPASRIITGLLEKRGRSARVRPYDTRVARNIRVSSHGLAEAEDGMAVGVEVLEPPDQGGVASGRVVEVLGFPDRPGMDIQLIVRKYDLRRQWAEDVLGEAKRIKDPPEEKEIAAREDFRAVPTVTIDGESAKDFDDAVSVQPLPGEGIRLYVHIADVAHYVHQRGAIPRGCGIQFMAWSAHHYLPVSRPDDLGGCRGSAIPLCVRHLANLSNRAASWSDNSSSSDVLSSGRALAGYRHRRRWITFHSRAL